jgi:hypothetical protein
MIWMEVNYEDVDRYGHIDVDFGPYYEAIFDPGGAMSSVQYDMEVLLHSQEDGTVVTAKLKSISKGSDVYNLEVNWATLRPYERCLGCGRQFPETISGGCPECNNQRMLEEQAYEAENRRLLEEYYAEERRDNGAW